MAHIKAPVPITGTHVSLNFIKGEADTANAWLIQWFREHGYEVTEGADEVPVSSPESGAEGNTPEADKKSVEGHEKPKHGRNE